MSPDAALRRALLAFDEEKTASTPPTPTGTELRVCQDIAKRQVKGGFKYGTTVEANPLALRDWLKHAYEEALDLTVYLKRAMEEMDKEAKQ